SHPIPRLSTFTFHVSRFTPPPIPHPASRLQSAFICVHRRFHFRPHPESPIPSAPSLRPLRLCGEYRRSPPLRPAPSGFTRSPIPHPLPYLRPSAFIGGSNPRLPRCKKRLRLCDRKLPDMPGLQRCESHLLID